MVYGQKFGTTVSKERLSVVTASITGTGAVTMDGHRAISDAVCSVKNAATTVTTQVASVTSISGVAVSVVVVDLQAAANAVSGSAKNVTVMMVVAP